MEIKRGAMSKHTKDLDGKYTPTRPNITQYTAANIVKGIDANNAPNFPTQIERGVLLNKFLLISRYCLLFKYMKLLITYPKLRRRS